MMIIRKSSVSLAIGEDVDGGTPNSVLFVDGDSKLGELNPGLTYDETEEEFGVKGDVINTGSPPGYDFKTTDANFGGRSRFIESDGTVAFTYQHVPFTNEITWVGAGGASILRMHGDGRFAFNGGFATDVELNLASTDKVLRLNRVTTIERDALSASNGMLIYNTSLDKVQVRTPGGWVSVH